VTTIVLDIETTVDPSLPAFEPRSDGDAFPPAPFWTVETIGVAALDGHMCALGLYVLPGVDERARLVDFATRVSRSRPRLVTFNGRRFDLPVLAARGMRHGVQLPYLFEEAVAHRYRADRHCDLADQLSDHGAARQCRLDIWARTIGMPGKLGTSGEDVAALIAAGEREKVDRYCLCDVAQTTALKLRADLTRGVCDLEEYRVAARALLDVIDKTAGAEELAAAIDRPRFLLLNGHEAAA